MRMSYKKLWLMLVEKEISQATLRKDLNIATGTMTKLRLNEEVAFYILLLIKYINKDFFFFFVLTRLVSYIKLNLVSKY